MFLKVLKFSMFSDGVNPLIYLKECTVKTLNFEKIMVSITLSSLSDDCCVAVRVLFIYS